MTLKTTMNHILAAGCVLPLAAIAADGHGPARPVLAPSVMPVVEAAAAVRRDAPTKTWIEHVGGVGIEVTGTTGPRYEPASGYSQRRRDGERERAELRERLNWGSLSDDMKAALWPMAVGEDNIDERGINLVNFAWAYTPTYRGNSHRALDMAINVDGDVVVFGQDQGNGNTDPDYSAIQISEIDGAANATEGWTENWERTLLYPQLDGLARFVGARQGEVDLAGNSYVVGRRKDGRYLVWKMDGVTGDIVWARIPYAPDGGSDATAIDVAVDAEGLVYVCGFYTNASTGNDRWFLARHRPSGNQDWIVDLGGGRPVGGIRIDRRGDLFLAGYRGVNHAVRKVSPYTGEEIWLAEVVTSSTDVTLDFTDALELDADGNPHYAGTIETELGGDTGWRTTKWDGETGAQLWSTTTSQGEVNDLEVDGDGNVYVCGSGGNNTFVLRKYAPTNGNQLWNAENGSTGEATDVVLDRFGNPYMVGWYGGANLQTRKYNPDNGDVVWNVDGESPTRNNESNSAIESRDIVIDGGGNIYICGFRTGAGSDSGDKEFFVVKYEQPYLAIPQIARSYPQLSMSGVSVWDPVPNDDDPDYTDPSTILAYNQEWDLFSFDVPNQIESTIEGPARKTIDYVLGEVSGGLDVRNFSGGVDVSLTAESSAGTFDASMTGELAIAIPGEDKLFATQPFDIVVNWDPDEAGVQLIADAEPTLEAGIKAKTRGNIDVRFQFSDTYLGSVSQNIADVSLAYNPDDPVIGIGPGSLPEPGVWVDLVDFPYDQYFSGQVRSPLLQTQGAFNASSSEITSSIRQKVLSGDMKVTNLIMAYFGQPPLSVRAGAGAGGNGWEAEFETGLLQADLDADVFVLQDLEVQVRPYVILDYEGSDGASLGSERLEFYSVSNGSTTPVEERTATVTLPADGELEINPRFGADVTFTNSSGVEIVLTRSFKPANLEASVALADVDLIDVDKCFECIDRSDSFEFRPYEIAKNIAFPSEHEIAPIQVFGNVNLQPQLIGASLEAARMIIYDQSNPSVSDFNDAVTGVIPVVLYGYNFFSGTNINVRMKHQGRTETLERTRLNNQALLVEIPKRMLLLPGTARLIVVNDNGRSETMDFVIDHPFPNFQGIDEDYWASDPRWQQNSIKIKDGGTPAGNDSFIVRRDYYTYLADNLWNPGFLQDLGNPDQEAWDYFETFKGWERPNNPRYAPGIPTLLVNGVAIPRDNSNPSSGRFRAEMPESIVAVPDFVDLQLCAPGPGGGASRVRTLEIAAPRPVISRIEPELVRPGDVDGDFVRIAVEGPASVPFFAGYEGEKHGNFTPLSKVWIDKTELETAFVSSSELTAQAPASLFDIAGTRLVRVVTSNPNGTEYFDFQIAGDGTPVTSGMVSSGGSSVSIPLRVGWPEPVIDYISHTVIEQGTPPAVPVSVDGLPPADSHNITIFGEDFAPGCRVFINGRLASSTRDTESSGIVRATLLAGDVSRLGFVRVYVENPAPDLRGSNTFLIEVIPAAPGP